jgi:hypothetical protein
MVVEMPTKILSQMLMGSLEPGWGMLVWKWYRAKGWAALRYRAAQGSYIPSWQHARFLGCDVAKITNHILPWRWQYTAQNHSDLNLQFHHTNILKYHKNLKSFIVKKGMYLMTSWVTISMSRVDICRFRPNNETDRTKISDWTWLRFSSGGRFPSQENVLHKFTFSSQLPNLPSWLKVSTKFHTMSFNSE